jgi:chemotaxis protein MotB
MTRRKPSSGPNHERWLVSYADFITLLFAFFVVLFASSQDRKKVRQVSESVQAAFQGKAVPHANSQSAPAGSPQPVSSPKPVSLDPPLQKLLRDLDSEIRSGKMQVRMGDRGLTISLSQSAFFPSGTDTLDPSAYPILRKVAASIRGLPNAIRFEGHTDSIPIRTPRFRSNWDLSAARAIAVMERMDEEEEIPRERIAVSGYADTAPVESNDSEDGRARNRRVDIVLLNAAAAAREPAGNR